MTMDTMEHNHPEIIGRLRLLPLVIWKKKGEWYLYQRLKGICRSQGCTRPGGSR